MIVAIVNFLRLFLLRFNLLILLFCSFIYIKKNYIDFSASHTVIAAPI